MAPRAGSKISLQADVNCEVNKKGRYGAGLSVADLYFRMETAILHPVVPS